MAQLPHHSPSATETSDRGRVRLFDIGGVGGARAERARGALTCIEPFPLPWLERRLDKQQGTSLIKKRVQDIAPEFFNQNLADGDVLFIDSTHTVKAGSDCLHLYLRVLPKIERNIMVHAHDIHLPFPLPQREFDRHAVPWSRTIPPVCIYFLDNPKARVVSGSVYNNRFLRDRLTELDECQTASHGEVASGSVSTVGSWAEGHEKVGLIKKCFNSPLTTSAVVFSLSF